MSLQIVDWPDFLARGSKTSIERERERESEGAAITIGVFDGVHLGHQALIRRIVDRGPNPTVLTFRENPKKISGEYEGDLSSLKQKLSAFENLGVSRVVLIDFSPEFSRLKGREFLDLLTGRGGMGFLAIGRHFHCGFRQDTDAVLAKEINSEKGIPTELLPPITLPLEAGNGPFSSSRIRSAVISGDLKLAAALLGRNFGLDLSDITPVYGQNGYKGDGKNGRENSKTFVYDLRSVNRIVPAEGGYSVLINPGGKTGRVDVKDGKVFLSSEADSLDFLSTQFRSE